MNIARTLDRTAHRAGDDIAIYAGDRSLFTFRELARRAAGLATYLIGMGARPGDRVAIFMANSPQYPEVLFGILRAGLVAVPVNCKLVARELGEILDDCGAAFCYTNQATRQVVSDALCGRDRIHVIDTDSREYSSIITAEEGKLHDTRGDDLAWLFFTSGTTGRSKGAKLSHLNLALMSASYTCEVQAVGPRSKLVHAAPMSHGSGMYIFPFVRCGAAQIIPESSGFQPDELQDLSEKLSGLSLFAAPTMVHRLVRRQAPRPFPGLELIVYGGGPMHLAQMQSAIETLGPRFAQIYGQGECPMTITRLTREDHLGPAGEEAFCQRLASVGRPFDFVDVRIDNEQDSEPGEILVCSPIVMNGYWGTDSLSNPIPASPFVDENGRRWLRTGDVGYFDEKGFLHLVDREKDVIVSGGTNIYSREVEDALLTCPQVDQAAVVGRFSEEWGEEVIAFIVGTERNRGAIAAIEARLGKDLARFKMPKSYRFCDELPKNAYGKVDKKKLKKMAEERQDSGS